MNTTTNTIGEIAKNISDTQDTKGVKRLDYFNISTKMPDALNLFVNFGKTFTPKFVCDKDNKWAFSQIICWTFADKAMRSIDPKSFAEGKLQVIEGNPCKGLYICGPTGTGKSLALEVLGEFIRYAKPHARICGERQTIQWLCYRAADIWASAAIDPHAIDWYKKFPILCIQDLGSEPASDAVYMGSRREPLREILEYRGDRHDILTLISSNYAIDSPEIHSRYGDRVASRLREMCNMIIINGKDRRG